MKKQHRKVFFVPMGILLLNRTAGRENLKVFFQRDVFQEKLLKEKIRVIVRKMERIEMANEEDPIETFMNLGLTSLQAKVYLTLLTFGEAGADVREISLTSKIARQDIYRRLPELEKTGLVEKIVGTPTVYRAVEFENGLSMLIKKNTQKYTEIHKRAKMVLNNYSVNQHHSSNNHTDSESQFVITSEQGLFLKRIKQDVEEAEDQICIIYSYERLRKIIYHVAEEIEAAMKRDVKIRAITDKTHTKDPDKKLQALTKNPQFSLRIVKQDIPVGLVIFDNREVNIRIASAIVPSMWTNNRNLGRLAKVYFEDLWRHEQSIFTDALREIQPKIINRS
jgi:sugar-specific transcriptional regulator TrmB